MNHKNWANQVKSRDKNTCQSCGEVDDITAHHINSWQQFPEQRYNINNGITLCDTCHKEFHKLYGKLTNKSHLDKFLSGEQIIKPIKPKVNKTAITAKSDMSIIGKQFGLWLVKDKFRVGNRYYCTCQCKCGTIKPVLANTLKNGTSTNCGCKRKAELRLLTGQLNRMYKHGSSCRKKWTKEYRIWAGMKTRCFNGNCRIYKYYGGRGITMCETWMNFKSFLRDMGQIPSDKHELERIDVNGDYEPGNCRWATRKEQCNNTRSNKFITFKGITKTYTQWEELLHLRKTTIAQRKRYGWSDEDCLKPINYRESVWR